MVLVIVYVRVSMEDIERKANQEAKAMIEKLEGDRQLALRMKRENQRLRKKIEALMRNNQGMATIVRKLDNKMGEAHIVPRKDMVYSYQDGMMVKKEEISRKRLELKKKHADMNEVNKQLNELLGIMKERNINIGTGDNNNKEGKE